MICLVFFAICTHMGVLRKPDLKDYWSKHPMLCTTFAPSIMTRDRFHLILAFLHVCNNDNYIPPGQDGYDSLYKIRPVYVHLQEKFKQLYTPGDNICVDEALCPWRGKARFRVYMKDKPIKWGIKLYELCDSENAYVYNFEIFGATPGLSNRPVDVVMRLSEPLLDEGRSVYADNYYTCPELADHLVERDTHCVGTVRSNRKGMPPQLKTVPNPQRGEVQAFRRGGVCVLRWMDNKPVHILTTKMDPLEMRQVTTRHGQRMKPVAVQDYIINMAGVDHSDQLLAYIPFRRKTMKWWKKLFFHLFTLSLIQGSILYNIFRKGRQEAKMPLKDYILACGMGLNELYQAGRTAAAAAGDAPQPGPAIRPDPVPQPGPSPHARLASQAYGHFLCPMPVRESGKPNYRRCVVCTARRTRQPGLKMRQTKEWCKKCAKPLCSKMCPGKNITCFEVFHTIKNYADF